MEKKDKELLLKDLCGRLPYLENWVRYDGKDYVVTGYGHGRVSLLSSMFSSGVGHCPLVEEVKPYLRPMSSMTEEERETYRNLQHDVWCNEYSPTYYESIASLDWLNKNMFDYRGLIPHGLAIEAPEGMYN